MSAQETPPVLARSIETGESTTAVKRGWAEAEAGGTKAGQEGPATVCVLRVIIMRLLVINWRRPGVDFKEI